MIQQTLRGAGLAVRVWRLARGWRGSQLHLKLSQPRKSQGVSTTPVVQGPIASSTGTGSDSPSCVSVIRLIRCFLSFEPFGLPPPGFRLTLSLDPFGRPPFLRTLGDPFSTPPLLGDLLMRAPSRRVVVPLTYGHTAASEGGEGREA